MRLTHLAIVLGLFGVTACGKKQTPEASKPVPAATKPSDPQPETSTTPGGVTAPASTAAPATGGSRGPVKKGGDPQDGGE